MKKWIQLMMLLLITVIISFIISSCSGGSIMNTATFETNQGTFKVELYTKTMPLTTGNFIKLTNSGFYDGTKFHRVISGFMVQGGDPLSKNDSLKDYWGTDGPGYKIKDEFANNNRNNRGTISMANAGPNTGGSQFFINVVNNNFLDSKHPVFGEVVEGMDIVDKIAKVKTDELDKPVENVIIQKIMVS